MPVLHSRHYSCVLASLALAGTAAAAGQSEDAIARCARIASVGDRILCLENAVREASPNTGEQSSPDTHAEATVSETPAAETELQAGASAAAANEVPPERGLAASGLGAEQVESRNLTREERIAALESAENLAVAAYDIVPYERLVVELENGQVWRQIKGDVQRIRVDLDRNQTVDISESRFGGYQLRLNEIRRTIRVERIK